MTDVQDQEDQAALATEHNMLAAGVPIVEKIPEDYFGFEDTRRIMLPDGVSWVEHQVLNEGQRRKYLNKINRDVTFRKATGDATMRLAPGDEKAELLEVALVNWNLTRKGVSVPFRQDMVRDFLTKASPKLIDLIEREVKKANPWLLQEMEVEDIDREIADLQEMRKTKIEADEGKGASSAK